LEIFSTSSLGALIVGASERGIGVGDLEEDDEEVREEVLVSGSGVNKFGDLVEDMGEVPLDDLREVFRLVVAGERVESRASNFLIRSTKEGLFSGSYSVQSRVMYKIGRATLRNNFLELLVV